MQSGFRIVYVRKMNFDVGLSATTELNMLAGLMRKGHKVSLLTTYKTKKLQYGCDFDVDYISISTIPILRSLLFYFFLFFKLYQYLLFKKVDLVVLDKHTYFMMFPIDILGKWGLIKKWTIIVDFRDDVADQTKSKVKNLIAKGLNYFGPWYANTMTNGVSGSSLLSILGEGKISRDNKNLCIFTSGVDVALFNPAIKTPNEIRGISEKHFVLIYHGAIENNRGLLELVESLQFIISKDRIRLVIAGSGNFEKQLKEKAINFGVENNIIWVGKIEHSQMPNYIASVNLGVLPYPDHSMWRMSSPIKMMEYLAMGKPVLIRGLRSYRESFDHLPFVFFLEDNEPRTIASALDAIVDGKTTLPIYSSAHRIHAVENLSWDNQISKFDNFIRQVLKR